MKLKAEMANKILFDIGHTAHVHYFKNIIRDPRKTRPQNDKFCATVDCNLFSSTIKVTLF